MTSRERTELLEPVIPRLAVLPDWCLGTLTPVVCLDGDWRVKNLEKEEQEDRIIPVPSDSVVFRTGGYFPKHYEYYREITVPQLSEESRLVLKFEAVNGFAEIYIDGVHVASHQNGFLSFTVEITEQVRGKNKATLRVAMDEESDNVSAYSHGGLLHSVYLYVLPKVYVNAAYLSPLFSEDMDACTLRVDLDVAEEKKNGELWQELAAELVLFSPGGERAAGLRAVLDHKEEGYYTINIPVEEPVLWDAEHPNMYTVEIRLFQAGIHQETVTRKTGLRLLERRGNRLFVNRQEIKLRGVCRHETSPTGGRSTTKELIEQDVALFKEANCNYIRTSHYPPTEYFLELCDEKGLYVEDELALAFIARTLPYTQRDPEKTERYISHFTECLARDYNHPSVIIWSLCNESFGGCNFDLLNRYVHRKDPTRMTKFSYPMTIREEHEMPDIWSIHYSEYDTDLAMKRDNLSVGHAPGKDMPVLHDEYVHVCCYNREELRRDQAVRILWGEGIRIFWDNIWNTEGALGGAIWAGIDETDIYAGGNTELEWGIIDEWRRKKPEFYMTRKAYSPIKVLHCQLDRKEGRLILVLENRFCHTNLSEVRVQWKWGGKTGNVYLPKAAPFRPVKAVIRLGEPQEANVPVEIGFYDANNERVDEMLAADESMEAPLLAEEAAKGAEEAAKGAEEAAKGAEEAAKGAASGIRPGCAERKTDRLEICREDDGTLLKGGGFSMRFSGKTGLLEGMWVKGRRLLMGGPVLNAPYLKLGEWYLKDSAFSQEGDSVTVSIRGGYAGTLEMTFFIRVCQDGSFTTTYRINRMEKKLPANLKLRVGVDCGGLDELGIAYMADPSMNTLSWSRRIDRDAPGNYTWYPADHISRNIGTAERFSKGNVWGRQPEVCWAKDMKNDVLNGYYDVDYKGTNDFRTTKERVKEAYLYSGDEQAAIGVFGTGDVEDANVRIEIVDPQEWKILDSDERISYSGTWYAVEDKKESDHGTEMWSNEKGAYAECSFVGTGIVWYGPRDTTYGMANVYIDGVLMAAGLSQRVAGVDFSCSSVGYDKKYHMPIYSIDRLPMGDHTIRIEVCGEKAPDASDYYIVIDYFRVLNGERTEPVKLIVNQQFAFPHISWGNYRKPPILMEEGTTGTVHMRAVWCEEGSVRQKIDAVAENQPVF